MKKKIFDPVFIGLTEIKEREYLKRKNNARKIIKNLKKNGIKK